MRYTVDNKKKVLTIHEASTEANELVELLNKFEWYKVEINNVTSDNSYTLVTDAGFQWTSTEPNDPYKIKCETEVAGSNDPCVCGKNKKKK